MGFRRREWILGDVYWNAILRNTISLTALQGSNKTNVIPAEASAELDIRLLPGTDPQELDVQSGMHGNNERISIANIGFELKYMYGVLRYVQ